MIITIIIIIIITIIINNNNNDNNIIIIVIVVIIIINGGACGSRVEEGRGRERWVLASRVLVLSRTTINGGRFPVSVFAQAALLSLCGTKSQHQ